MRSGKWGLLVSLLGAVALLATGAGQGVAARGTSPARAVQGAIAPTASCGSLATLDLARVQTVLRAATEVNRDGDNYCSVTGYISPQTQFQVLLPVTTWTGGYLQQGCGGLCGHVSVTDSAPQLFPPSMRGQFVLASDDQGHESPFDYDGLWARNDLRSRVVFGYTSEHSLAMTARALIRAYYGRHATHRYFVGASDGGNQALDLAQRFPADFDGLVVGAPALNWSVLVGLWQPWLGRINLDSRGRPILTAEKLPALHAAVLKACANSHGVITDPRACTFRPESIKCSAGTDSVSCLTPAEVRVVRAFYRGPTDAAGRNLFDGGEPYGSELAWRFWMVQPADDAAAPLDTYSALIGLNYLRNMAFWKNPPLSLGLRDIPFTVAQHRRLQQLGDLYDATDPDLRAFRARGGKLIMWHGWADQAIPPFQTLNYYRAVVRWAGGYSRAQAFSRLYMVPGTYHCPCGIPNDGDPEAVLNLVTPLVRWVEEGVAPGTLTLPITQKTSGEPLQALDVSPFNPLAAAPRNNGLNSNYRYVGLREYEPGHELWCNEQGLRITCSRNPRSASR